MKFNCHHCGHPFQVDPSRAKHGRAKHCSKQCQYGAMRSRPKKHLQMLECQGCGDLFFKIVRPADIARGAGKFCNRACRDKHRTGPLSPNWQGGTRDDSAKRGKHWPSVRRRILERDRYVCQSCGSSGTLHVHHKIPYRMFDDEQSANRDENLISLCPPCHRTVEAEMVWTRAGGEPEIILGFSGGVTSHMWQLAASKSMTGVFGVNGQ